VVNNHAVCSCQKNYIGSPPSCRPECVVSSDCSLDKACLNQKCQDPCPGTCGVNARCNVNNHNPICSCSPGFVGDPFIRCVPEESKLVCRAGCFRSPVSFVSLLLSVEKPVLREPENPCSPSPCGPNSQCRVVNGVPVCSCLPNYVGRAPNCRPECTINAECPGNRACIGEKCQDPCVGACGTNALCTAINHSPVCSCQTGYTGDPFSGCTIVPRT
jgi:hypothetical protein